MAIAAFKDLCLDAADGGVVGRFWSAALGLPLRMHHDGDADVHGPPLDRLWINQVPEAKVAKNRVHLDVYGRSVDALVDLGATMLADHERWQVMADPEGNELCLFPDPGPEPAPGTAGPGSPPVRPFALCVDSAEPVALAAWWAEVLGGTLGDGPDGTPRWIHGAAGMPEMTFKCVPVDDARVAKNRCHWDVTTKDLGLLTAAGATVLRARDDEIRWTVMADPQGNEFCAFTPG
jgi:hypothetical protein